MIDVDIVENDVKFIGLRNENINDDRLNDNEGIKTISQNKSNDEKENEKDDINSVPKYRRSSIVSMLTPS